MRVLTVVAQRNETVLLEPWVRYHAYLVGIENVHIIDNASDDEAVIAMVNEFEALGIGVTRIPPGATLDDRGPYIVDTIMKLERDHDYGMVFPMDADEFLCIYDEDGALNCTRSAIMAYIAQLAAKAGQYEIRAGVENLNKAPGLFVTRGHYTKVFFTSKQIKSLTIGSHEGEALNGTGPRPTRVFYLHFQVKPHSLFVPLARQKLQDYVDVNDREALLNYVGNNGHVARYVTMTEAEYDEAFEQLRQAEGMPVQTFPGFDRLMRFLGLNPNVF